jgi:hypothetical protein
MVKAPLVLQATGVLEEPEDMDHCTAVVAEVAGTTAEAVVAQTQTRAAPMPVEAEAVLHTPTQC